MTARIAMATVLLLLSSSLLGCEKDAPSAPRRAQLVYVAMGASDAVGIGAFPLSNGYVYKIRDGLQGRADEVILYNLGVSGVHVSYLEEIELPTALARQPDVVTIWTGPNDLIHGTPAADFERSLSSVFAQLRRQTGAFLVMANVPDLMKLPRFLLQPDPDVTMARILAFNDAILRQTAAYRIPLIDLFAGDYAAEWEYVSLDGFHPSNKGHAKLAALYLDMILPGLD